MRTLKLPKQCVIPDCQRKPLWHPVIKMWAKGYPKTSTPIRIEIGMSFCEEHKKAFTTDDIPELEELTRKACAACGRAQPDQASAEVELVPILIFGE